MAQLTLSVIFLATGLLTTCKSIPADSGGRLNDIGFLNTENAKTMVLYGDQGLVHLKKCKPVGASPLSRACNSDSDPTTMIEDDYFNKLSFYVGAYPKNEEGLATVSKYLQDARVQAQAGNQNAQTTVQKLEAIEKNLKIMVSLRKYLNESQNIVTYYEYQDEFATLLAPFGISVGTASSSNRLPRPDSAPNSQPQTPNSGGMTPQQCFKILRKEMSANWYDNNIWPACLGGGDLSCVVDQFRMNPDYYPEDLPEPCGGVYHIRNQPKFDTSGLPTRPKMEETAPPKPVNPTPTRPSTPTLPSTAPVRPQEVSCWVWDEWGRRVDSTAHGPNCATACNLAYQRCLQKNNPSYCGNQQCIGP